MFMVADAGVERGDDSGKLYDGGGEGEGSATQGDVVGDDSRKLWSGDLHEGNGIKGMVSDTRVFLGNLRRRRNNIAREVLENAKLVGKIMFISYRCCDGEVTAWCDVLWRSGSGTMYIQYFNKVSAMFLWYMM